MRYEGSTVFSLFKQRRDGSRLSSRHPRRHSSALFRTCRIERLEDRLAPVVGTFAEPLPMLPGSMGGEFDGVVHITTPGGGTCTGSLLPTTRHILTAAHCVDDDGTSGPIGQADADGDVVVRFDLARGHSIVPITVLVPADRITVHPAWQGLTGDLSNDLAILRLTDREPGFDSPSRQLVAPYSGSAIYGRGYDLLDAVAVGQEFTLIGYGRTGNGSIGQDSDEIQFVVVSFPDDAVGTFQLAFMGQLTTALSPSSTGSQLATALANLPAIGIAANGRSNVVAEKVDDNTIPGYGAWMIRFVGDRGGQDQPLLTVPTVDADGNPVGGASTIVDGHDVLEIDGVTVKRLARNRFDNVDEVDNFLSFDFDSGDAAQNSSSEPSELGLGFEEGMICYGDSGGPSLVTEGGTRRVAGVASHIFAPFSTDINHYEYSDGSSANTDCSFGERGVYTQVAPFLAAFINPALDPAGAAGLYDLVLDMDNQVLGVTQPGEDLTITARRVGDNLELEVSGSSTTLDGLYFSGRADRVISLTIRGSNDNETIRIVGNLGIDAIRVNGRTGNDRLIIDRSDSPDAPGYQIKNQLLLVGGTTVRYAQAPNWDIEVVELRAGSGNDTISVEGTAVATPVEIHAGSGHDIINVGTTNGLDQILGTLSVQGEGGVDALNLYDQGSAFSHNYGITAVAVTRTGAAQVSYETIESLLLDGGSGGNIVAVQGTLATTPVTVNAGPGDDTIYVGNSGGLQFLQGALTINGQSGTDALDVHDEGSGLGQSYAIAFDTVSRGGAAPIAYATVESLLVNCGSGGNAVNVQSTLATTPATVNAGLGDDTIVIGNVAQSLDEILGALTINGESGSDGLTLTDQGTLGGQAYDIASDEINRTGAATIAFATLENLTLNATGFIDEIAIESTSDSTPVTINAGDGDDLVVIGDVNNSLNNIQGTVTAHAGPGSNDNLHINDQGAIASSVYTLTATTVARPGAALITYHLFNFAQINGSDAGNVYIVDDTSSFTTTLNSGTGLDTVFVRATTGTLTVNGQDSFDFVTVSDGGSVRQIHGAVTVTNEFSRTALTIDDSSGPAVSATLASTSLVGLAPAAIQWVQADLRSLVVKGGGAGNTFIVAETPFNLFPVTTTLNSGAGNDLVTVQATSGPLTIDGVAGMDEVTIGSAVQGVQQVGGGVTVRNLVGQTSLMIDDSANNGPALATLQATILTGLSPAPIDWVQIDLRSLVIRGGGGGNTFTIADTPSNLVPVGTTVHSGTGVDTVNVQRTTGPLTVNGDGNLDNVLLRGVSGDVQGINGAVTVLNTGPGGFTGLTIDDTENGAPIAATLAGTTLVGLAPAMIDWNTGDLRWLRIRGGSGGNSFTIANTPFNLFPVATTLESGASADTSIVERTTGPLTVDGVNGADTVRISDAGTVQFVRGPVHVLNPGGRTTLTIDDSIDSAPSTAALGATGLFGLAPAPITWVPNDLASLVIGGGTGGNTFTIVDTPSNVLAVTTTLKSGAGGDIVTVQRTTGPITINGVNGLDSVMITSTGSVQNINAAVTVRNTAGHTALVIDDSIDSTARAATLGDTSLTGLAPATIDWAEADLGSLVVHGGSGSDSFVVVDTPMNLFPMATTLNSGAGADVVTVIRTGGELVVNAGAGNDSIHVGTGALALLQSPVVVNGEGGGDLLTVNDQGNSLDEPYMVTPTAILHAMRLLAGHDNIESLVLNAGSGNNVITVSPSATANFSINGGAPTPPTVPGDTLVLELAGVTSPQQTTSSPGAGQFTFGNRQPVSYSSIESQPSIAGAGIIVVGTGVGRTAIVRVLDANTREVKFSLQPYEQRFSGGVRVAVGDVNGDGIPDVIAAPGPGRQPQIRVFDGSSGRPVVSPLQSLLAFERSYRGGVYVAAGDVNGDHFADLIAARGSGKPEVRIFDGAGGSLLASYSAYAPKFTGGVNVAAGDFNGDGYLDIVTAPGPGKSGPLVKVFSGSTGALLSAFFVSDPSFRGGVFLAAGDVDGDGKTDIITGVGIGVSVGPHVRVFSGGDSSIISSFFVYDASFRGGVRVAAVDTTGDGLADIITAPGAGAEPRIRLFDGGRLKLVDAVLADFLAEDPSFRGGLFVAGGRSAR